jgi:hypothetical protein
LGRSYTYSTYDGVPVNLNNGNTSNKPHWDITWLHTDANGKVYFDNNLVQVNGRWVDAEGNPDARFSTLNYGWEARPESERPTWYS